MWVLGIGSGPLEEQPVPLTTRAHSLNCKQEAEKANSDNGRSLNSQSLTPMIAPPTRLQLLKCSKLCHQMGAKYYNI